MKLDAGSWMLEDCGLWRRSRVRLCGWGLWGMSLRGTRRRDGAKVMAALGSTRRREGEKVMAARARAKVMGGAGA